MFVSLCRMVCMLHVCKTKVYPSLELSARIGTLWWNGSEQLLSVEVGLGN